ncbi:MAG: acyl-CoA reductase, partial [Elusimicrobiaceae bacterium]
MKTASAYLFGKNFSGAVNAALVARVMDQARSLRAQAAAVPQEYIIGVLERTGKLFAAGPWRETALKHLKASVDFSPAMTEKTLDILPELLSADELEKRISLELLVCPGKDGYAYRPGYDGAVKVSPKGVVLHVGAGNVFLGIIDSLVLGILTRNVNVVKTSSSGSRFAVMFANALKECDTKGLLADKLAILSWHGGEQEIERAAVSKSDAVFVWGGRDAILSYRRLAPENVAVTGFGPKVSFGVVMPSAVELNLAGAVRDAVRDAALWDQSACASAHTLYLICPDRGSRSALLKKTVALCAEEFSAFEKFLPQGRISDDEKVEILRARELAKIDAATGAAVWQSSFPASSWTVIGEEDSAFRISPLNRVLYVKCAGSLEEIAGLLLPHKGFLQTAGIAGTFEERKQAADAFAPLGVARITRLGKMLESVQGSPHDGLYPMSELVNFVGVEGGQTKLDRFAELVDFARTNSPFYREFYKGLGKIRTLADFASLPF